jgi:UDP-glucuronate 4-epimerase
MALFKFTKSILEGNPIDVFNNGEMQRDFTYIGDITEGVLQVLYRPPEVMEDWSSDNPDPATSGSGPYRIFNIGRGQSVELMKFIDILETKLGKKAEKNWLPMQAGDVPATWADTSDLEDVIGYQPKTSVEVGVSNFVEWYLDYYGISL